MEEIIRRILGEQGKLDVGVDQIRRHDDLYDRGMTSHAVVNVMLALEEEFDFEFPDQLLVKKTFQTMGNLEDALNDIGVGADA